VEKVNLEEQTPVERQYPFQVKEGEAVCLIFCTVSSLCPGKITILQNDPFRH
jgi:hypothetical protein